MTKLNGLSKLNISNDKQHIMSFLKRLFGYKVHEKPYTYNVPKKPYAKKSINRIFISYSSRDLEIAKKTCIFLESQGLDCWFLERDMRPENEFVKTTVEELEKSDATVLIFSKYSNESRYVQTEIQYSFDLNHEIFSLRIDDTFPEGAMDFYLKRSLWIDASPNTLQNENLTLEDVLMELFKAMRSY